MLRSKSGIGLLPAWEICDSGTVLDVVPPLQPRANVDSVLGQVDCTKICYTLYWNWPSGSNFRFYRWAFVLALITLDSIKNGVGSPLFYIVHPDGRGRGRTPADLGVCQSVFVEMNRPSSREGGTEGSDSEGGREEPSAADCSPLPSLKWFTDSKISGFGRKRSFWLNTMFINQNLAVANAEQSGWMHTDQFRVLSTTEFRW